MRRLKTPADVDLAKVAGYYAILLGAMLAAVIAPHV
jgi:hypothetical protein